MSEKIKSLLLVGDGNSIFFINYVRALKEQLDIEVTVYSPIEERFSYEKYPYDYVYFDNYGKSWLAKIRFFGRRLQPFFNRIHLNKFLKHNDKIYDIIHVHWVIHGWVLFPSIFKKYGKSFGTTLWGGELEALKLFGSHKLYLSCLKKYLSLNDFCIDSFIMAERLYRLCPLLKGKCHYGIYGSSIIEELSKLNINTEEAKTNLNIPKDKTTILLGYSGKAIHRHIAIIDCILDHPLFEYNKEKIHLIASMTRGASAKYIKSVKKRLLATGCTYTIIENVYQSDTEVAILRKATDIAFQLSVFDGLSNSVKEILIAGTVLICGKWFPNYSVLKEDGYSYIEVEDIKSGVDELYEIINNEKIGMEIKNINSRVDFKRYLWSECIKNFINVYDQLQ